MKMRMNFRGRCTRFFRLALVAGLGFLMLACGSNAREGKIIAVELDGAPGDLEAAQLVLIDPDKPGNAFQVLLKEFASSASPCLSHEGRGIF